MTSRTSPCSPGSGGSTLRQNGRDSIPLARSSRTPMPCESCERDSEEGSIDGQTSAIYRQRTLDGELASTARPSSPGDSPASRSPVPGSEEARRTTAISGRKCLESCGSSGPLGCLEKMLLESSIWNSNLVVLTWKVKVIPFGRSLFQLAGSEPCTEGNGCLLLPTPTFGGHNDGRMSEWGGSGNPLRMWLTPKAEERGGYQRDRGIKGKERLTLTGMVKLFPTPTARDYRSQHAEGSEAFKERLNHPRGVNLVEELQRQGITGQLNPPWVEWLMGFPIGWTDCDVSEMPSSRSRCTRSLRGLHRLRTAYRIDKTENEV